MADLQATTATDELLYNSGASIDGISRATLAADTAFSTVYATKAELADLEAGSGNLPAGGTTGQVLAKNSGTSYDVEWVTLPSPSGDATVPGVLLEDFDGASDDAKLGNAMTYCNAQEFPPAILLWENRDYGPFTTQRTLYSGFRLLGPPTFAQIYRSAESQTNRVLVNRSSSAWLTLPSSGSIFDVEIANLSFYAQSSTTDFLAGTASGVLWTSRFKDCGWSLFRHIFGTPSQKLLNTACVFFAGFCQINNARHQSCTFGGSDSAFGGEKILVDCGGITPDSAMRAHIRFDNQQKVEAFGYFITAESTGSAVPAAFEITGNSSSGTGIKLWGLSVEGRNPGQPCKGDLIRISGGCKVQIRDIWIAHAMSSPSSTPRGAAGGVIHVSGGSHLTVRGLTYNRATGVDEDVPIVYATGSGTQVRVFDVDTCDDGGSWTEEPKVETVSSATAVIDETVIEV